MRGSFQETAPRKTAEKRTLKHRDSGVGSVVANHCDGGESLVVVTTLLSPSVPSGTGDSVEYYSTACYLGLW